MIHYTHTSATPIPNNPATPTKQVTTPTRNDPVEVSILHLLIMLIFMDIKVVEIQEPHHQSLLHGREAVLEGQVEGASPV